MGSALHSIFTVIVAAEFIFGNLSNGFIVLINFMDYVLKRKLSLGDQILVFLALSRVGLIWEMFLSWLKVLKYSFSFMVGTELRAIILSWVFSNHFSLWIATILSIFYLLKIASFSRPVFLYLKWRVKKVLVMILLGNLVFLLFNVIQMNKYTEDWMRQYETNTTWNVKVSAFARFSELAIFTTIVFSLVPFTVALVSFLLLIYSLWIHLQKMKFNSIGHRDPSTKAHKSALRIIVSFLLLYATYFMSLFISWLSKTHQNRIGHMLCLTLGLFYPSGHSFILMLGNPKLRQACLLVLRKMMYWLKH
uniref:Taste receptor type 2 n=1 Tax=Nannospalax galili TaxID=1026970 RepID=A0A0N9NYU6_NANGA|nr:taste receptor type 2 member 5 [Nannospalax galili]